MTAEQQTTSGSKESGILASALLRASYAALVRRRDFGDRGDHKCCVDDTVGPDLIIFQVSGVDVLEGG